MTYFAPESRAALADLGLRGFWMGYFAGRAAPLGPVGPGVVEATFFNFHPAMVRRAIPDAWTFTSPQAVIAARSGAAAAALRRHLPHADGVAAQLLPLLIKGIASAPAPGRPLFAANRDVAPIEDPVAGVWQAATTLREHRGDGHVAILTEAGLDGCQAHVLYAATEGIDPSVLADNRGWSADDWETAGRALMAQDLLASDGTPTEAGHDLHAAIEHRTDELATPPYPGLDAEDLTQVLRLAARLAGPVAASGEIPYPNPIGLPAPGAGAG